MAFSNQFSVIPRVRSRYNIVPNLATSGLNLTGDDLINRRLEPIKLKPELASLDVGSVNFSTAPFVNSPEFGETAATQMREAGVKPEIEVFDIGHIALAKAMIDRGLFEPPPYFQLCMGIRWGSQSIRNLAPESGYTR